MHRLLLLITTLQLDLINCQDLKTIFHTPRRNYDDFEILERANFGSDDTQTAPPTPGMDKPQAYANAQVMLRFGAEKKEGKCACGEECRCGQAIPYIIPVLTPLPYYVCPPTPQLEPIRTEENNKFTYVPPPPQPEPTQNENVVQEKDSNNNINHPEILNTVDLSNDIIQEDLNQVKCLEEVSNKLEPNEVSPNVKLLTLDLNKPAPSAKNDIRDFDKCLLPYKSPKQAVPKLLVTYPIFNRPQSEYQSGYSLSEGSGYYTDPVKTVIYRRPTVLTLVGPQRPKYVLVPVSGHTEDCSCCSCAKYVGELNEKTT